MNEKKSFPFKLRILSWIPTAISLALVVPLLFWVLLSAPPGILLCKVDGSSMDTALHHGQYVYQDGRDFSTGDIVICRVTEADGSETVLVKRIVGMPGDKVSIVSTGVYINGNKLEESYLTGDAVATTYREDLTNYFQLEENEYCVLGDNRRVSWDSRYFGAVDYEDLLFVVTPEPGRPFYLTLAATLALLVPFCWLVSLLDKCFITIFRKRSPALDEMFRYMEEEEKQKKEAKNKKKNSENTDNA